MWHVILHAAPRELVAGPVWASSDGPTPTLRIAPGDLQQPLPITFEAAISALEQLPQMFCEPDGWFDWTSPAQQPRWQIAGQLHDRGPALGHVEAKFDGAVTSQQLDQLLAALGWPAQELVFQIVRESIFLDEPSFRRLLRL